ncbi:enoyl-[acyl-carrier-protein] reductase [NADH] [Propionicimonas paludicola]|uniref:Enoyl-[acyl-carrier-protein] reductase [NADH] n=1 Tax=Propionicimonas paludicola TaxID=185243 RepID=A0A2A9CS50_9ACTN|nr:enoyl-ACP reductase FabI [Propionicimonas paludicola]PFG16915.1 enoyl-[acyl-carrier-protein] reductase [NADH] [Propionicimonas paludicola]
MGILEGKNLLVAGVTMNTSIGYRVVELAQAEGANVVVSNFGRALSLTGRVLKRLDPVPPLLELDVTDDSHLASLAERLGEHFDHLDGVVHSIAYANPERALGGAFLGTEFPDVSISVHTSAYSLVSLAMACKPLMRPGSSVVGLTFDARVSWPTYDWMGVSKAALESASRYLARYLGPEGIRSNLVAAGPLETIAKKAIPGAEEFNEIWAKRAPLGWDPKDLTPTAKAVIALLSDWFPATTGEMVHVDGGLHSTGA